MSPHKNIEFSEIYKKLSISESCEMCEMCNVYISQL